MNNEIDPFEEFEFKPITEGLGFHRDSQSKPNKTQMYAPLPTKASRNFQIGSESSRSDDVVDEILKSIEANKNANLKLKDEFPLPHTEQPAKIITSITSDYLPSPVLMTSIFLDLMLITATSLLFLVALLAITKIDLLQNLKNPDAQGAVYWSLFAMVSFVGFLYYVTFRSILGFTPGEWAYDQKIEVRGNKVDSYHILKLGLRSFLIILSGYITLPLISWVVQKDLLGNFIDARLVRKK